MMHKVASSALVLAAVLGSTACAADQEEGYIGQGAGAGEAAPLVVDPAVTPVVTEPAVGVEDEDAVTEPVTVAPAAGVFDPALDVNANGALDADEGLGDADADGILDRDEIYTP